MNIPKIKIGRSVRKKWNHRGRGAGGSYLFLCFFAFLSRLLLEELELDELLELLEDEEEEEEEELLRLRFLDADFLRYSEDQTRNDMKI